MSLNYILNPKIDTPLFAATAVALQLYHSPREEILVFNSVLPVTLYVIEDIMITSVSL